MSTFQIVVELPAELKEQILDAFDQNFSGRGSLSKEEHALLHITNHITHQLIEHQAQTARQYLEESIKTAQSETKEKFQASETLGKFDQIDIDRTKLKEVVVDESANLEESENIKGDQADEKR